MQSVGINAACENLTRRRHDCVIRPCQTRDGIQQNNHIFFVFYQAFGFFDDHFGNLNMAAGRFVKSGSHHFAFHRTHHFGNFFGAFVNQQHNQFNFRIIFCQGVGNVFQHYRFTCFGRSDQQSALSFANRCDQINRTRS